MICPRGVNSYNGKRARLPPVCLLFPRSHNEGDTSRLRSLWNLSRVQHVFSRRHESAPTRAFIPDQTHTLTWTIDGNGSGQNRSMGYYLMDPLTNVWLGSHRNVTYHFDYLATRSQILPRERLNPRVLIGIAPIKAEQLPGRSVLVKSIVHK